MIADRSKCGQSEHHIAELAEVDNEDIFVLRMSLSQADILQHSQVRAGHLLRLFDAEDAQYRRSDVGK